MRELKHHINDRVLTVLVGNKSDLTQNREIPKHVGENFAQRYNLIFYETSAKDSENVESIFAYIAETLTRQARQNTLSSYKNNISTLSNNNVQSEVNKGSCCS
jgi:GTPase SAR1 family protein